MTIDPIVLYLSLTGMFKPSAIDTEGAICATEILYWPSQRMCVADIQNLDLIIRCVISVAFVLMPSDINSENDMVTIEM